MTAARRDAQRRRARPGRSSSARGSSASTPATSPPSSSTATCSAASPTASRPASIRVAESAVLVGGGRRALPRGRRRRRARRRSARHGRPHREPLSDSWRYDHGPPRPQTGPYFGEFGGRFVPESLIAALDELSRGLRRWPSSTPRSSAELAELARSYTGRPSIITEVPRFAEHAGGARIILKREDLNHTGSHKINNVLGQALLTRRIGKTRVIAETGAGQHGVATATAAALFGLDCIVYMGEVDTERQALNVARMRLLGAEVVAGDDRLAHAQGRHQRGDARLGHQRRDHQLHLRHGRRPAPVPGDGARLPEDHRRGGPRSRCSSSTGALPDAVAACVGGGSNAIGIFHAFLDDTEVALYGFEAGGRRRRHRRGTPRRSPRAAPACCTARAATCCRTRTARPSSRTRSPPASTTRASAPSTPGSPTSAAPATCRSTDAAAMDALRLLTPHRGHHPGDRVGARPRRRARARPRARPGRDHPREPLAAAATRTWRPPDATSTCSTRSERSREHGRRRHPPPQRRRPPARSSATCPVGFPDLDDEHRRRRRPRRERRRRARARPAVLRPRHGRPGHPGGHAAALANGFRLARRLRGRRGASRDRVDAPVLVMTYWNPVLQYGVDRFADDLAAAGGAGLITPDLIPDEARRLDRRVRAHRTRPGVPRGAVLDRRAPAAGGRGEPRLRLRRLHHGHHRRPRRRRRGRAHASSPAARGRRRRATLRRARHLDRRAGRRGARATPTARSSARRSSRPSPTAASPRVGALAASSRAAPPQ